MGSSGKASGGAPSIWRRLDDRHHADCRIFEVRRQRFSHPVRGTEGEFFVIRAPDWVNVIALTREGHLVLVRQFRFAQNELSLEIPGGVLDEGEDPVQAGLRELCEETGYVGESGRILASVHPNPAILTNTCHLVLVEGAHRSGALAWDDNEEIEVLTAPVEEVLEQARSGRITHSLVLNALFFLEGWWRNRSG